MPSMQHLYAQYPDSDAPRLNLGNSLPPSTSGFDAFDAAVDQVLGTEDKQLGTFMMTSNSRGSGFMEVAFAPEADTSIVSVGLPSPALSASHIQQQPFTTRQDHLAGKVPRIPTEVLSTYSATQSKTAKKKTGNKKKEIKNGGDVENSMKKPKRSLSAYNIFFQNERKRLLASLPVPSNTNKPKKSHGKIGFADMARSIAAKWKKLSAYDKLEYEILAAQDTQRYEREMAIWKKLEMKREMEIWKRSQAKLELQRRLQQEQSQEHQRQMMLMQQQSTGTTPQVMHQQMALFHAQKQQQHEQFNNFQW